MKLNLNLSGRISLGYLFIILIAVIATVSCILMLNSNKEMDNKIKKTYMPGYLLLRNLSTVAEESQKLSNNWIYQPNKEDKERLLFLQNVEYNKIKGGFEKVTSEYNNKEEANIIQSTLQDFEEIIGIQKQMMDKLSDDSLYSNDVAVDAAITLLEKSISPKTELLLKKLGGLSIDYDTKINSTQEDKQRSYELLSGLLIAMIVLFIVAALLSYIYTNRGVVKPIMQLESVITALGQGKTVSIEVGKREDEIGKMSQAIMNLMSGMEEKLIFAEKIGKGYYDESFNLLSEEDTMGRALITMCDNLKANAKEEKTRTWATEGLAQIGSILRSINQSNTDLFANIIKFVVNYTRSNQAGLFILNKDDSNDEYLELSSCYAYERKKYQERKIYPGEGLVGQCMLERETMYLTEVPKNYVNITSGLGQANPTAILIVPLKINNDLQGILELASFRIYEKHEIEFIERLAENIAATVSNIRVADRTKILLQQSQQLAEDLKSQEEEMRQNMEELSATQEEMSRKEHDYLARIKQLESEAQILKG
jgi:hypothetical protein